MCPPVESSLTAWIRAVTINWPVPVDFLRAVQPNISTRWTGQTRLINVEAATRESWLVRCSPRAPGVSREQSTKKHILLLFFCWLEFSFMVTEILQNFATTVKRNSQYNCIKNFPSRRYKEKQVSLLAASRKDSVFLSQKKPVKYKALFP